uniref:BTB domain-containing protein n=1 Tax=Anopheles epiroticus TaxID=199890 RepID=A0A182PB86_9DIPT
MSVQQYCLRWNNHQPNFISVFSTLLHNESLVDVTLAAEGRQLQAHKVVLSACSSYFQSLFTANPCQHPIVILKDVQYNDLKTMVDFMYYGEVNVSTEQLPQVLKTAEMLKIKGLAEMPDASAHQAEEQHGASADPSTINLVPHLHIQQQVDNISYGTATAGHGAIALGAAAAVAAAAAAAAGNNIRIIKESPSSDVDQQQHESSQESVDETGHHMPSIIKTEDLSGVTQTLPMDISTTPTAVNITQSQSQHT